MRPPQTPLRGGCAVGLQGVLVAPCSSYPLSSAAERQAHNLEVGGSKPPGGIFFRSAIQTVFCRNKIDTYSQTECSYYQARTTNYTN